MIVNDKYYAACDRFAFLSYTTIAPSGISLNNTFLLMISNPEEVGIAYHLICLLIVARDTLLP